MNKTYFVLSQGEQPVRVFLCEELAKQEGSEYSDPYLDVFDEEGIRVQSLKFDYDSQNWTEDF